MGGLISFLRDLVLELYPKKVKKTIPPTSLTVINVTSRKGINTTSTGLKIEENNSGPSYPIPPGTRFINSDDMSMTTNVKRTSYHTFEYMWKPLEGETYQDIRKKKIWLFRVFKRNGKLSRIMTFRKSYPKELLSHSNEYQIMYSENDREDIVDLNPISLYAIYQFEPFKQILSPLDKIRYDCFLCFDTEWDEVLRGQYSWKEVPLYTRVQNLRQIAWVVYGSDLQPIIERDFRGNGTEDFGFAIMQLACDMAEYTPTVIGHNIIEGRGNTGFDVPALKRFFDPHPALNRNCSGNFYYDTMHGEDGMSLDSLLKIWIGRNKANPRNALQDVKDTFEVFWRSITNY